MTKKKKEVEIEYMGEVNTIGTYKDYQSGKQMLVNRLKLAGNENLQFFIGNEEIILPINDVLKLMRDITEKFSIPVSHDSMTTFIEFMQEHTVKNFKKDSISVSNVCDVLNLKDFTAKLQNRINALSELLEQEVKKRKELEDMYKALRLCYDSHIENNASDYEGLRTSLKMHRNDINAHKE